MQPPSTEEEAPRSSARPSGHEAEAYTLQVFFEPEEGIFCATFLEFPELKVEDESRSEAIYAIEDKLHSHLAALRQSGHSVPAPIRNKEFPSTLEVPISQGLYHKLEILRHQERISMDQLVTEILTAAVVRKPEAPNRSGGHGGKDNNRRHSQNSNQRQGQGRGGRGGGRNFHDTMESRENFMEYVRNLEKGGGPGYKKR